LALKLLAKVENLDPTTHRACGWDDAMKTNGRPALKEARFPYFSQGFIDIDLPRDKTYTMDITDATVGYAVADEQGNVLGEFKKMDDAVNARANAQVQLPKLVLPTPEPEPQAVNS